MDFLRRTAAELARTWREARFRHPRLAAAIVVVFAIVATASVAGGIWFLLGLRDGMPEADALLRIGDMDQATSIFDVDDRLAFTIYKEQRIEVPITEISSNLLAAVLAVEDQRFYDHHGFDLGRILSAAAADVRHRRVAQGASTLTQQLARQSFLRPDKTLHRKVQEVILAARIERLYSKQQILELYLNKVYFGDGLYGVEAASRGYFGKHASELSLPEAALLAGLVKSPSSYAPTVNMQRATARRNVVLQAMLDNGAIDRAAFQSARRTPVVLHDTLRSEDPHGEYFKEQVRLELVQRFGWQRVYQGGLRVFSTIDMPMQVAAETAVADTLKALDARRQAIGAARLARRAGRKGGPPPQPDDPLQAALVAMDPDTGHVRAMVGGRDFDASHFNRAMQARRQPGSAFKPFVYAAALESGFTPASVVDHLDDPITTAQGGWTPEDEHSTASSMTLRTGLRTSSNRAAVRLLQEVGIGRTVQYARQMGVGDVPAVPSLALGSGEVTLMSMTAAYSAFADHGLVPKPVLIRRVEDQDGRLLYDAHESPTRAIGDTTAFLMSTMLADVVNAGTAAGARRLGFTLPAAGKTGTTNDFKDAWFVGFTPKLAAGVWVGFDRARTILPNGFAAEIAVPLWTKFMKVATRNDKPEWLAPPDGVVSATICRVSGKLATDYCRTAQTVNADGTIDNRSTVYTEYFARGTEPTTVCDVHGPGYNMRIAGVYGDEDRPATPHVETPVARDHERAAVGALPPPPPAAVPGGVGTAGTMIPPAPPGTTIDRVRKIEDPETTTDGGKKRGFWGRLFHRGDPDAPPDIPPPPPPKKKGGQ